MRQINQIEDLIQKQVDVIIVWPVNSQAIVPACKKAKKKGIPTLIANTKISESGFDVVKGFVGPDFKTEGSNAAELMHEALPEGGKIVEIKGLPGYATSRERSVGFRNKIKEEGWDIEIIDAQPADWNREKAQRVMENFLTKYSSGEIDGIYASDDNLAMGAINALKSTDRLDEVEIVSACMFGDGYEAIKEGNLYGTCLQSPIADAKKTVHASIQIALGWDLPFFNYFKTPKITKENIDQFEKPTW
jgi:ribose transport system substrate-binding protein